MNPHVTLSDIAKKLGVSKATICYALNDSKKISPARSAEIKQLAQSMGYLPDPALSRLAHLRWPDTKKRHAGQVITFLSTYPAGFPPRTQLLFDQIKQYAENLGYTLENMPVHKYLHASGLQRVLLNRGTAGLIINAIQSPDEYRLDNMDWSLFPTIACGGGLYAPPVSVVDYHVAEDLIITWSKLRESGYRRIGAVIFSEPNPSPNDAARYGAVAFCQHKDGANAESIPPFTGNFSDGKALIHWINQEKPDALIGFHDGVYWLLRDAKCHISDNTGFASLLLAHPNSSLSGMYKDDTIMAKMLVQQIDLRIRLNLKSDNSRPTQTLISSRWIEGETHRLRKGDRSITV